jgi:urease accessory protein
VTPPQPAAAPAETAALDPRTLSLLLAWVSPSLPVGSFAYSHGLERLYEAGALADAAATERAVAVALRAGGRADAVLLAAAWRAAAARDDAVLEAVRALAVALAPAAERREETVNQGNAFAMLADAVWPGGPTLADDVPLPVALGAAGAAHAVPLAALVHAHLAAFAAALISAAVRLVPLGQTDGQRITARLAPLVAAVAAEALAADLDDVGGAAPGLDIAAMTHEVQEVRLFRS